MTSYICYSKSYNYCLTDGEGSAKLLLVLSPQRLTQIRSALELSQEGISRLLGVSFASVNRWENGHSSPTGTVFEVYRALDAALKAGKTARQILGNGSTDPGHLLNRIFRMAYGG